MKDSIFSQRTLSKIKTFHKVFLWVASGVMIISLLLGVILIFVDTQNAMFGKLQGTFFFLAAAAFICVNNFIRIEKGNKIVQSFALTGLLANVIWLILGILMIWGAFSPIQVETASTKALSTTTRNYEYLDEYDEYDSEYDSDYDDYDEYDSEYDSDYDEYDAYNDSDDYLDDYYNDYDMNDVYRDVSYPTSYATTTYNITPVARIIIVAISIASIGFWVSNILVIKDSVKAVKPLKITAIVCQVYGAIFVMVIALAWPIAVDQNLLKWTELSGLTVSGFLITAIAAWIISRTHKDFDLPDMEQKVQLEEAVINVGEVGGPKVPKETQKEVRQNDTTPLQAEDMPPSVGHDDIKPLDASNEKPGDDTGIVL